MQLSKFVNRLIAARRPFSVVEIKNDPRITNVNGKQSAYNLVDKNGYGVAEFGCDELAATWFCEAANRYADEIYSRRSTTHHKGKWLNGKDNDAQDIELKPCPFCGGKAKLLKTQQGGTSDPDPDSPMFTEYGAFVRCSCCGCKTGIIWKTYHTPNYIDAVIAVWNRRTTND